MPENFEKCDMCSHESRNHLEESNYIPDYSVDPRNQTSKLITRTCQETGCKCFWTAIYNTPKIGTDNV